MTTRSTVARPPRPAVAGWLVGIPANLLFGALAFFPLMFTLMVFSAIAYRLGDHTAYPARDGIDIPIFAAGLCWLLFLPIWYLANRLITLWSAVPRLPYWLLAAALPCLLFAAELVFKLALIARVF